MDMVRLVIPGYTFVMKTAISVPNATFDRVEKRASELGLNRSEFFTRAAERYLKELDESDVTQRINAALVLETRQDRQETAEFLESASRELTARSDDEEW
jgi:metal-responsive CopG/Arc/MetJ family transcriptional regulator